MMRLRDQPRGGPRLRLRPLVLVGLITFALIAPAPVARAQLEPGQPASVAGDGAGAYRDAGPVQLRGALARAVTELDNFPIQPTPEEVKASTLRRRLLELRLLMDFNAYVYDPRRMDLYRSLIDSAYEDIGEYQDIAVTRQLLGEDIDPTIVEERLVRMVSAVAAPRIQLVRDSMDRFFAAPSSDLQPLAGAAVPRLWAIAMVQPTDELDSTGNLARYAYNVMRGLRASGLFVADIFDQLQEDQFHDTRKAIRSILILSDLFPGSREALADLRPSISKLVSAYGDVNDRVIAYHAAEGIGRGLDERANDLRVLFADAQVQQQRVVDEGALDTLIQRLQALEATRRR